MSSRHSSPRSLVLASASPRRRALLEAAGIPVVVAPADIDESQRPGERPEQLVERLAREKATTLAKQRPRDFVLAADTIVLLGDRVLGKPRDAGHAEELLGQLVGETHTVWTGVAVASDGGAKLHTFRVASRVTLREADAAEIRDYVASGEPLDKAGAYALQGEGTRFVERVEGSRSNVIGLPIDETFALLRELGGPEPGPPGDGGHGLQGVGRDVERLPGVPDAERRDPSLPPLRLREPDLRPILKILGRP